jgi:hypothetical protein
MFSFGTLAADASEEVNRCRPRLSTAGLRIACCCWLVSLLAANRTAAMAILYRILLSMTERVSFSLPSLVAVDLGVRSLFIRAFWLPTSTPSLIYLRLQGRSLSSVYVRFWFRFTERPCQKKNKLAHSRRSGRSCTWAWPNPRVQMCAFFFSFRCSNLIYIFVFLFLYFRKYKK